jgi:hypothetical protein
MTKSRTERMVDELRELQHNSPDRFSLLESRKNASQQCQPLCSAWAIESPTSWDAVI